MLPLLLAATLLAAGPACPDPGLANPHLKVVRADVRGFDDYIVTVEVGNRGTAPQTAGIDQHLDLLQNGKLLGTQPIPALGPGQTYISAFRLRLPHERKRKPLAAEFRYVLADGGRAGRENCNTANDALSATL